MKNKGFFMGILGLLLVFGLITMGCDNGTSPGGDMSTKFEGTWKTEDDPRNYWVYHFEGKTITGQHRGEDAEQFDWEGTFDFNETEITFAPTSSNPSIPLSGWTQPYQILENPTRLKLTNPEKKDMIEGEFKKQP
jgi:hypothetical protein